MEKQHTGRGFAFYEFKDNHGNKCSLQKSSNIKPCIWLGAHDVANNRMELSVEIVKELLPILQKFVETEKI